ncbi:unnamed protein product [Chrysoparadoxa australica]
MEDVRSKKYRCQCSEGEGPICGARAHYGTEGCDPDRCLYHYDPDNMKRLTPYVCAEIGCNRYVGELAARGQPCISGEVAVLLMKDLMPRLAIYFFFFLPGPSPSNPQQNQAHLGLKRHFQTHCEFHGKCRMVNSEGNPFVHPVEEAKAEAEALEQELRDRRQILIDFPLQLAHVTGLMQQMKNAAKALQHQQKKEKEAMRQELARVEEQSARGAEQLDTMQLQLGA